MLRSELLQRLTEIQTSIVTELNLNLNELRNSIAQQKQKLNDFETAISNHSTTLVDLRNSFSEQHAKMDGFNQTLTAHKIEIESLRNDNAKIEEKFKENEITLTELQNIKASYEDLHTKQNDLALKLMNIEQTNTIRSCDTTSSNVAQQNVKTFSSLFKSHTQNEAIQLQALNSETKNQESRRMNFIITGLDISSEDISSENCHTVSAQEKDAQIVAEIARDLEIELKGFVPQVKRFDQNNNKKIHVTSTVDIQREFVRKAKQLRNFDRWKNVYINPDLTKAQQEEQYLLRKALREAKLRDPSKDWIIRNHSIVTRPMKHSKNQD